MTDAINHPTSNIFKDAVEAVCNSMIQPSMDKVKDNKVVMT